MTTGETTYTIDKVGTENPYFAITGIATTSSTLVIPGKLTAYGEELEVKSVDKSAIPAENITAVEIQYAPSTLALPYNIVTLGEDITTLVLDRNVVPSGDLEILFGTEDSWVETLVIGDNVTKIAPKAFASSLSLETIEYGENPSLTTIGDYAFTDCHMEQFPLPESLTTIGKGAFSGDRALTSITIPAGVTEIPDSAFYDNQRLVSVTFKGHLANIGTGAFQRASSLKDVTVNADNIRSLAFADCQRLATVNARGDGRVYKRAFTGSDALTTATLDYPEIGREASDKSKTSSLIFDNCANLASVTLGDNVQNIAQGAFNGHTKLAEINLGKNIISIGDSAFYRNAATRIVLPSREDGNTENLKLGKYCFYNIYYNNDYNREVKLGDRVLTVATGAFGECSKVDLGPSVQIINADAFRGKIDSVIISANVKTIMQGNFTGAKYIEVKPSETPLSWAMYYASGSSTHRSATPETLIVNRTINNITEDKLNPNTGEFYRTRLFMADKLKDLRIGVDTPYPVNICSNFMWTPSSTHSSITHTVPGGTIHIGPMVREIDEYAIKYPACYTLIIDEGVTKLGRESLCASTRYDSNNGNHEYTTDIVIPGSVESYELSALGYYQVKTMTFKKSDKPVTLTAYNENFIPKWVEELSIDRPVDISKLDAIVPFSGLKTVVFGDNAQYVPANMFKGYTWLETAILSDSLTEIGDYAFNGCSSLKILPVPKGLTHMGDYAFEGCTAMERVVARTAKPVEGTNVFSLDVEKSVPCYVPAEGLRLYKRSSVYRFFNLQEFGSNIADSVVFEPVDSLEEDGKPIVIMEPGKTKYEPEVVYQIVEPMSVAPRRARAMADDAEADAGGAPKFYWMSSDPTIASVDQTGLVTVHRVAPVEIYAYVLDGSDKRATLLVNPPAKLGDANGDYKLDSVDINLMINHITAAEGSTLKLEVGDMNNDGEINSLDLNLLIEKVK